MPQQQILAAQVSGGGAIDASAITTGTIATARLGSGAASNTTFLRGDQTYAVPAGGGGSSGTVITVANGDGVDIPKGSAVSWFDQDGAGHVSVSEMSSSGSGPLMGILLGILTAAGTASLQTDGIATGLDTSGFSVGDVLYPNASGVLVNSTAGLGIIHQVGEVLVSDATNGSIFLTSTGAGLDRTPTHNHASVNDGGALDLLVITYGLQITEITTPSAPPSGTQIVFVDIADHVLKRIDSAASVHVIG